MTEILNNAFIFLAAAVIAVPLSKRLGLGSVLGYLIAGIIIGPVLGLVGDETEDIKHVAEFGVVMMLFLVGLELEPQKLWALRHRLFGLGALQVGLTVALIFGTAMMFGFNWSTALAIGMVLSLSSTAIVIQTLNEKGMMKTHGGQSSFSVLLFQDIAVIPMLALLPLLVLPEMVGQTTEAEMGTHLLSDLSAWQQGLITVAAMATILIGGHYLAQPIFRYIALSRLREMFTAFALLLVVGISALMSLLGLSPALGTFLAGVVLATSAYRHELESNIEPFKGLLLGLFFITVGAGVDFGLLQSELGLILGMTAALISIKFLVLWALGKAFKLKGSDHWLFALCLAQAGEFGFVLLSYSVHHAILPVPVADQLLLVIALSMLVTPLLFILLDKIILPLLEQDEEREMDAIESQQKIILVGNGRYGQIIHRLLNNCGYEPTVIDHDVDTVEGFSRMGFKTFFGDGSRPHMLAAAGIDEAKVLIVTIDDKPRALELIKHAVKVNPDIKIVARAYDRLGVYDMYNAGAKDIVREVFDSSIRAGRLSLKALGMEDELAKKVCNIFYDQDRHGVRMMAEVYDPSLPRFSNQKMSDMAMQINAETTEQIQKLLNEHKKD